MSAKTKSPLAELLAEGCKRFLKSGEQEPLPETLGPALRRASDTQLLSAFRQEHPGNLRGEARVRGPEGELAWTYRSKKAGNGHQAPPGLAREALAKCRRRVEVAVGLLPAADRELARYGFQVGAGLERVYLAALADRLVAYTFDTDGRLSAPLADAQAYRAVTAYRMYADGVALWLEAGRLAAGADNGVHFLWTERHVCDVARPFRGRVAAEALRDDRAAAAAVDLHRALEEVAYNAAAADQPPAAPRLAYEVPAGRPVEPDAGPDAAPEALKRAAVRLVRQAAGAASLFVLQTELKKASPFDRPYHRQAAEVVWESIGLSPEARRTVRDALPARGEPAWEHLAEVLAPEDRARVLFAAFQADVVSEGGDTVLYPVEYFARAQPSLPVSVVFAGDCLEADPLRPRPVPFRSWVGTLGGGPESPPVG